MTRRALALAGFLAVSVAVVSAATIAAIQLADGADRNNRIDAPVYRNPGLAVEVTVTGTARPKTKFVRRTGGRLPATRGPEYDLDPSVNIGVLLTDALRSEAAAMGLTSPGNSQRWQVTGTITDVYLESRQVYMGATLFYGYLEVALAVNGPDGSNRTVGMRLHNYSGGYNAGLGRRDEAAESAARLLVEGAQEILARLNRDFFKAPPSDGIGAILAGLRTGSVEEKVGDLRKVGLSGLVAAAPALLELLQKEPEEKARAAIVDALALLGSADAVAPLSARYKIEDEDVRWYTLKAMDYIGGADAERLVKTAGLKDDDNGPKRLAARISKTP
jgi:hypothetical protein